MAPRRLGQDLRKVAHSTAPLVLSLGAALPTRMNRSGAASGPGRRSARAVARRAARRADQLVEVLEVGLEREPALLAVLERDRAHEVAHLDDAVVVGGLEGGRQRAVADRAARELELGGEEVDVDVLGERRLDRQQQPPDPLAVLDLREREVD